MCLPDILGIVKDFLIIIGILIGVYLSIKYYNQFSPNLNFRITPLWSTVSPEIVVIRIEIENKSKVKINKKSIKLKLNLHQKESLSNLNEWVDLGNDYDEICKTTKILYPESIMRIERLYKCDLNEVIQGIVQFEANFSRIEKVLANIQDKRSIWTTTFIIAR